MKRLWTLIRRPPRLVLFCSAELLKDRAFKWAPTTLLGEPKLFFFKALLLTDIISAASGSQSLAYPDVQYSVPV